VNMGTTCWIREPRKDEKAVRRHERGRKLDDQERVQRRVGGENKSPCQRQGGPKSLGGTLRVYGLHLLDLSTTGNDWRGNKQFDNRDVGSFQL